MGKTHLKCRSMKQILAIVMSLCMALSVLLGLDVPVVHAQDTARVNFNIHNVSEDIAGGEVFYMLEGDEDWTSVNSITPDEGGSRWVQNVASDAIIGIKVVPEEGYTIDTVRGVMYGVRGAMEALAEEDIAELTGEDGYWLEVLSAEDYELELGFAEVGQGGSDNPGGNLGMLSFTCQSNVITGGSIYYKLDEDPDFSMVDEDNDIYNAIDISEVSTLTLVLEPCEGYQLDSTRGVVVRADGNVIYTASAEDITALTSEEGKTFTLQDWVDAAGNEESTLADLSFDLEFAFESTGGGNPGGDNPSSDGVTITVGDTVMLDEGVLAEQPYYEQDDKKVISVSEENGWITVHLNGCDLGSQTLSITGKEHIALQVEGDNKLLNIQLGSGTMIDGDGNGTLTLMEGVEASDGTAGYFNLANDVVLYIGSKEQPAQVAFNAIDSVLFNNYEFHSRDKINAVIYAEIPFVDVKDVMVQSAKVQVYGEIILFTAEENDTNCTVFQEGQIRLLMGEDSDLGMVALRSKYYQKYPTGAITEEDGNANGLNDSYMGYRVIDPSAAVTEDDCRFELGENSYTLTSLDPILYAISYVIDEGISFPNPDKGTVTMNGFEKGYYTLDGRDGHFEAWIAAGEPVNVTILPAVGYQYVKDTLNVNGTPITGAVAGEERGTYTFIMPENAGHICAGFAKTEDTVTVNNDSISEASIENADKAIESGNAKLDINSVTVTDEDAEKIAAAADGKNVAAYMDVDLTESIIKNYDPDAAENDAWNTSLHELSDPVTITVKLDVSLAGNDGYQVIREHEGTAEVIDTEYDDATGQLTFDTDRFSTYAIAYNVSEHTYGEPTFTWSDDGKTCEAVFECVDGDDEKHVTASVTGEVKTEATCQAMGTTTYTATVLFRGKAYQDTKDVQDIAMADHKKVTTKKAATNKADGKIVTACSECGEVFSTTTIKKIKSVTLTYTSRTYTGELLKPGVIVKDSAGKTISKSYYTVSYKNNRNVGKATVTIKFKGNYSGTVTRTFKINPKSTTISKLTPESKGFKVTWKKQPTQTSGYQIQYATNKSFTKNVRTITVSKNSTVSKSITKLKPATKYYVKIRTYRSVGGTKYYSDWKVYSKTVTTKK
ncbi:MAG: fibronectin type III domain-containing protein [Wujia sp.]